MPKFRITVLVENTAAGPGLVAEHGLAYWIEHNDQNILFDTGQTNVLAANAYKLGVKLHYLDALVLSHGHYDHTGGVAEALKTDRAVTAYVHPAAFSKKFIHKSDLAAREIGMPYVAVKVIQHPRHRIVSTLGPTEVVGDVTATGPVPRLTDYEDTGGTFFLDQACTRPDPIEDDQSLFFNTTQGTVVLLGCAHSGVINILNAIRQFTGNRPIAAVIGGMHLVSASEQRLGQTIEAFRRLGVKHLAPAHCTGMPATVALWNAFPGQCQPCPAGTRFEFD